MIIFHVFLWNWSRAENLICWNSDFRNYWWNTQRHNQDWISCDTGLHLNDNMNHNTARNNRRKKDVCGKNFLKVVLYVFIFFFWLTGLAFLGLGLYIKFMKHTYISLLGSSTFPLATYLLIGTGAFILLSGIIGCAGSCKENRCFMVMYAIFLLVIFLSEAIAGVLAYMYEGTIQEELSRNLNTTMMDNYNLDSVITQAVDNMQTEFNCCGATDFENWEKSKWIQSNSSYQGMVPDSCCITVAPGCAAFGTNPSNINPQGCSKSLVKYTKSSLVLIGGIGLGLCIVQLIGIIFSCCLVRKFRTRKHAYSGSLHWRKEIYEETGNIHDMLTGTKDVCSCQDGPMWQNIATCRKPLCIIEVLFHLTILFVM